MQGAAAVASSPQSGLAGHRCNDAATPPAQAGAVPFQHPGVQTSEDGTPRLLSPLRYPGAKRQLIPFFRDLLLAQPARVQTFVEPFAGGASISLYLAVTGLVDRVVIAERDPLLYAFWRTAVFDTAWLQKAVAEVEVSIAQWDKFREDPGRTQRDKALACLFLNRTSFSGILHGRAGPIGGRRQATENTIDCRFNPDTLSRRLGAIGALADAGRIAGVWRGSYERTIPKALGKYSVEELLLYLDPPFYAKSQTLYRFGFDQRNHQRLAETLFGLKARWVLSYDRCPATEDLYRTPLIRLPNERHLPEAERPRHRLQLISLTYSAHSSRRGTDELIVTNLDNIPIQHTERLSSSWWS
jgi:DNA adenine methylase